MEAGHQLVNVADVAEPFLLAATRRVESLGPRHSAIERAEDEWHAGLATLFREQARCRRAERGDAMDDIKLPASNPRAEFFPHQVLEIRIADRLQRRGGRPIHTRAAA